MVTMYVCATASNSLKCCMNVVEYSKFKGFYFLNSEATSLKLFMK